MLQRHNMLQRQVLMLRAACEPLTAEDRSRLEARPACCFPCSTTQGRGLMSLIKGYLEELYAAAALASTCRKSALHIALPR